MDKDWEVLPSDEVVQKTAEELNKRNFSTQILNTKEEALQKLKEMIPEGASVMNGSSTTLIEIGMVDLLQNQIKWNNLHTPIFAETDPEKRSTLFRSALLADYYMASPNAITEDGLMVAVDRTGSRTGALPFAAKNVILVVGINKITKNLDEAMQRIREFVFPLEDKRSQAAYGTGSGFGKWVIMEHEINPNRVHVLLVKEKLGF